MSALQVGMRVRYDLPASKGNWCDYLSGETVCVTGIAGIGGPWFSHAGCAGLHSVSHAQVVEQAPAQPQPTDAEYHVLTACGPRAAAALLGMAPLGFTVAQVEAAARGLHDLEWGSRAESLPPVSAARLKQWDTRTEAERDQFRLDACAILTAVAGAS